MPNFKRIYALLKAAGKTNEWLHEMLPEWVGKSSLKELTPAEFSKVCTALENTKKKMVSDYGMRTEKQAKLILFYKSKLKMTPQALNAFILRTTGEKDNLDSLKIAEASAVINGLMKLKVKK